MGIGRIMSWGIIIGLFMAAAQILNLGGYLDSSELNIYGAFIKVGGICENLKVLLIAPEQIYTYILEFNPEKSGFFIGIEGLTGTDEEQFLRVLLYNITFVYFFIIAVFFAKISTIFLVERDRKLFFAFSCILYFVIVKVLGN